MEYPAIESVSEYGEEGLQTLLAVINQRLGCASQALIYLVSKLTGSVIADEATIRHLLIGFP